jgi:hypothetical protein
VNGERISLLAMVLGLLMIGQPWSQFLFAGGFAVALAGVVAFNVFSGRGGGK